MDKLIARLRAEFPDLHFTPGSQFYWSPETTEIFYKARTRDQHAVWSLLHETGHALLGHRGYKADFELLKLEVAAWEHARKLALSLKLAIDEDHIQDCLDTYRDWLYKRSICPNCTTKSLQQGDFVHYRCFNCHAIWRVTASRFCRAYRRQKDVPQSVGLHLQAGF
ncbi:MAG TPA: ImmA/IrrE family metallo-endopeptidase [Candidatus Saccharimonadales bacterium]